MLEYIAKKLLEKETLDEKEFEELMNEVRNQRNGIENNNQNSEGEYNG